MFIYGNFPDQKAIATALSKGHIHSRSAMIHTYISITILHYLFQKFLPIPFLQADLPKFSNVMKYCFQDAVAAILGNNYCISKVTSYCSHLEFS